MNQQKHERTYSEMQYSNLKKDKLMHGICGGYFSGCFFGFLFFYHYFKSFELVSVLVGFALMIACGIVGALIVHFVGDFCVSLSDMFNKHSKRYGPVFLAVVFVLIPLICIAVSLFAPVES